MRVLDRMMEDPRVVTAARIGRQFRLDPIVVLDSDRRTWLLRVAASNIVAEDERRAYEQSKPKT